MNTGAAAVLGAPTLLAPLYTADVVDEHGDTARVEYVTAAEITNNMPGVTAARLRDWADPHRPGGQILRPVTVAQLAAEVFGLDVDGDQPARVPSPHGPMNVYRLHQVRIAERRTRRAARGRKRTGQYAAHGDPSLLPAVRRPALGARVIAVTGEPLPGVLEHGRDYLARLAAGAAAARPGEVCGTIPERLCGAVRGDPDFSRVVCHLPAHGPSTPHEARHAMRLHLWADDDGDGDR